jgi:hypothetical protein
VEQQEDDPPFAPMQIVVSSFPYVNSIVHMPLAILVVSFIDDL